MRESITAARWVTVYSVLCFVFVFFSKIVKWIEIKTTVMLWLAGSFVKHCGVQSPVFMTTKMGFNNKRKAACPLQRSRNVNFLFLCFGWFWHYGQYCWIYVQPVEKHGRSIEKGWSVSHLWWRCVAHNKKAITSLSFCLHIQCTCLVTHVIHMLMFHRLIYLMNVNPIFSPSDWS